MAKAIKFKKFKRFDAHKAEAGVPHAIRDEVGNYYGTFITSLFDPHNKFIQRESKRYYEKFGTSPENQGDKASLFAFVQICVHGWEGVEEEDGKAVPFSKEAAFDYLSDDDMGWAVLKLMNETQDVTNYQGDPAATQDEVVGN